MRTLLAAFLVLRTTAANIVIAAPEPPLVEKYLLDGNLADGEKVLSGAVKAKPDDAQARFGLGVIQLVPNTKQHSVMPNGAVTIEMIKGWLEFLEEASSILKGEKLIPFWRPVPESGINIKRVFTEPRTFDLVLWVQGTAAAPYLEKGPCTSAETWTRF